MVPAVFSAKKYPSEVEVNGTSLSSAGAENAWRLTSAAQSTTVFTLS
jgi:hypothetical protein